MRISAYFDGYNFYHALLKTGQTHHKWCDLKSLISNFVQPHQTLSEVHYFSAYATWRPDRMKRHRDYTGALAATGVKVHLARFSEKSRRCNSCGATWKAHEEKETDVKLAVTLLQHASEDRFDRALIVSRDSDLVPAAKAFKTMFPNKEIFVVAPFASGHSTEMLQVCDGKHKITRKHLDRFLLPEELELNGRTISRPSEYNP